MITTLGFCAAMALAGEADNVPKLQLLVAQVISHRMEHRWFPKSECEVVFQKNAFPGAWRKEAQNRRLQEKAFVVLRQLPQSKDLVNKSIFYHRDDVKPYWVNDLRLKVVLYQYHHYFYAERINKHGQSK